MSKVKFQNQKISGVGHTRESRVDFFALRFLQAGLVSVKHTQAVLGTPVGFSFADVEGVVKAEIYWEDKWSGLHPTIEISKDIINFNFTRELLEKYGYEIYTEAVNVPVEYMMREEGDQKYF